MHGSDLRSSRAELGPRVSGGSRCQRQRLCHRLRHAGCNSGFLAHKGSIYRIVETVLFNWCSAQVFDFETSGTCGSTLLWWASSDFRPRICSITEAIISIIFNKDVGAASVFILSAHSFWRMTCKVSLRYCGAEIPESRADLNKVQAPKQGLDILLVAVYRYSLHCEQRWCRMFWWTDRSLGKK